MSAGNHDVVPRRNRRFLELSTDFDESISVLLWSVCPAMVFLPVQIW